MKVAIYTRVSSESQVDNTSLTEQIQMCHALSASKGWEVVNQYQDEGISGAKDEDGRPALDEMLQAMERGEFSTIVIKNESRLARDTNIAGYITHKVHKMGGEIIFAESAYDPNTLEGMVMQSVLRMFAQIERIQIVARTTAGRNARGKVDGERGGQIPTGYSRVMKKNKATGEITINETEAETVRLIFAMRKAGDTLAKIATHLNDSGIKTRRGGKYYPTSVSKILNNEDKYTGGKRGKSGERWLQII